MKEYKGNCPRNVSKDAKYVVRYERGRGSQEGDHQFVVGITYRTEDDERWYASTSEHPELVSMVNEIKHATALAPGGGFYINEHSQVLVPSLDERKYYLAGEYYESLVFNFEGLRICGIALDDDGDPLKPGAVWKGPHVGIPYTLKANAKDVYYRTEPRPNVTKDVLLSKEIGADRARRVATMLAGVKGGSGGRVYVNEHCHVFTPRDGAHGIEYIYVGQISLDDWFPKVE